MIARENKFMKTNLIYYGSSPSSLEKLMFNSVVLNRGPRDVKQGAAGH